MAGRRYVQQAAPEGSLEGDGSRCSDSASSSPNGPSSSSSSSSSQRKRMTVHEARRFLTYQDLSESQEEHDAESQPGEMDHFQLANNDPRNDTPMSSPEPASVGRRKERPSRLVSPPCSLPNGLKERPGEPDSAEWARLTGRQDPVAIRDRYSNPLHLERTILSPAISEVSELPTRAGSFKTQSSLISLAATASHPTANYSEEGSTWSTTSSTFSTMSAPVDPLASISNHVRALDSATNQRARSDPALRQVTTVSEKDHQHRAKSVSALVEHASADEQEELAEVSHKQASNRQASDRRAREEEQRKAAEERFAVRSQARERYLDRRDMLSEKQILLRQLASTSDPMRQARIQRELADMCLSSALDLADAACTRSEGYKKICENAVVFCRQALERQMAMVEVGNCSPEEVSDTWYMLGRAHEALSEGVDAPEGLSNKQYALAAYGHSLSASQSPQMRARVWCSQGVLQCSLGNYTASRDAFDCAVREDSSQIRAWLNLGQLWENWFKIHGTPQEKAQSVRRARLAFWRAARINPDEEHALARLEALGGPPEEMSYTTSIASDEGFYSGQSAEEIPSAEEEPPDVQVRVSEAQDDVKHQEDHGESVTEEREVTPSGSSVSYESTASPEPPVPHSSPVPNPPIPHISAMTDQNAMEPNVESAVPQMPQPSELCESAPASSMPMPDFVCEPDEQHMAGPSPPDYHTSRILDAIARVESNQRQIQQQLESLTTVTNGALSRLERLESSVNEQQPLADDRPYNVRVSALELQLLECGGGHAAFGRAAMEAAREAAHTTPSREQDVRRLINRYGSRNLAEMFAQSAGG